MFTSVILILNKKSVILILWKQLKKKSLLVIVKSWCKYNQIRVLSVALAITDLPFYLLSCFRISYAFSCFEALPVYLFSCYAVSTLNC